MLQRMECESRISVVSDIPVLLLGETGTGKELLARAIHRLDPKRCEGPFVPVNSAAISSTLAESEFFGHRRGAFTGAIRDRPGLFRAAHGGVLFLDEVGDLTADLQGKLLRVLQDGRILPVGGEREVAADVRVVTATNRDLDRAVRNGSFRPDLFHRLQVLTVRVPALRERREDIPHLVEHFIQMYGERTDGPIAVSPSFLEAIERLPLEGNVRQLEGVVRQALLRRRRESALSLTDLPPLEMRTLVPLDSGRHEGTYVRKGDPAFDAVEILSRHGWSLARSLDECELRLLQAALRESRGNRSRMARLLGVTSRTIYNKLHKHGLDARV